MTGIFSGKSVIQTDFLGGKWSASGKMIWVMAVHILDHECQSGCAGVSDSTYKW